MCDKTSYQKRQEAAERRRERARIDREKDTFYWLKFEPLDKTVPCDEVEWRIILHRNPAGRPEDIEEAISAFEKKKGVESWREIAARHYVDHLWYP